MSNTIKTVEIINKSPLIEVVKGCPLPIGEAVKLYSKVSYNSVRCRINAGWDPLAAVLLPRINIWLAAKLGLPSYLPTAKVKHPKLQIDHIGKEIKGLKIISRQQQEVKGERPSWLVECLKCQTLFPISNDNLNKKKTEYCKICISKAKKEASKFNRKSFNTYTGMLERCYNPKCAMFYRYGARGITVCEEWLDPKTGRESYKAWILSQPKGYDLYVNHHYQIDRIDNDGNYCPENCRLVTVKANCNNRNTTKYVEIIPGRPIPLQDAIEQYSVVLKDSVRARFDTRKGVAYTDLEAIILPDVNWTTIKQLRKLNISHPVTTTLEEDLRRLGIGRPT